MSDNFLLETLVNKPSLFTALEMSIVSTSDTEVIATMPVNEKTIQPFGFLNGGASLAFAETIAGYGSIMICDKGYYPIAISVSCNHISRVPMGQIVKGVANLIHKGKTTHIWNIDIISENKKLVSSIRLTNMILQKP